MKQLNQEKILVMLRVLLVIGMLLSLTLLYQHFSPATSTLCTFGESLDCDIVNKSPYANLDGVFFLMTFDFGWNTIYLNISNSHWFWDVLTSNAFLGFLTLLFLFGLTLRMNKGLFWVKKERVVSWIRGILMFSVCYGMLLIALQHFIIQSYCLFCLGLDAILIASLIVSYKLPKVKQ